MTTSEQARADAMADAATLRRFVAQHPEFPSTRLFVMAAQHHGRYVQTFTHPKRSVDTAVLATHAAFRAVPGLSA